MFIWNVEPTNLNIYIMLLIIRFRIIRIDNNFAVNNNKVIYAFIYSTDYALSPSNNNKVIIIIVTWIDNYCELLIRR